MTDLHDEIPREFLFMGQNMHGMRIPTVNPITQMGIQESQKIKCLLTMGTKKTWNFHITGCQEKHGLIIL